MIAHTGRLHRFMFPQLVWRMDSQSIFLTFDDGPHPIATPQTLKVLQRANVKATFFLSGDAVRQFPDVAKEIASEGHGIGIHAYSHLRAIALSKSRTMNEILRTEDEISKVVRRPGKIFRPPFGFFSWKTISAARALEYKIVMWSTLSGDFRRSWSDDKVIETALSKLSAGSIIVFHDNELTKTRITNVLTRSIDAMAERGFTFEAIL